MSNINFDWIEENVKSTSVIFDIGCADMHDTVIFKQKLPLTKIYAFECEAHWQIKNHQVAIDNNIYYFNKAVTDFDGEIFFYPSEQLDGMDWKWSGSTSAPSKELLNHRWRWGAPYAIKSVSLNTFCNEYNIIPDFIHVDAQGAEYNIFKDMNNDIRPQIIWTEISEFHMYNTGVSYDDFKKLLESKDYIELYKSNNDALYVLSTLKVTPYK